MVRFKEDVLYTDEGVLFKATELFIDASEAKQIEWLEALKARAGNMIKYIKEYSGAYNAE
jgi:hypothetical protein